MALNEEKKKLLLEMWKTSYGKVLLEYLEEEYAKIGDIMTCENEIDLKGRQESVKFLKRLFSFLKGSDTNERGKNNYV